MIWAIEDVGLMMMIDDMKIWILGLGLDYPWMQNSGLELWGPWDKKHLQVEMVEKLANKEFF